MEKEKDQATTQQPAAEDTAKKDELSVEPVEDRANPDDPGIFP